MLNNIPKNAAHGDRIADKNGNIYEFDSTTDSWIKVGIISSPPVASKESNGLISPDVWRKLKLIQTLLNNNTDFRTFKIATKDGKKPYFYYFNSSDGLIKFIPESPTRLRIEIDKHRLFTKALITCCPGPKGDRGDSGDPGNDGIPADPELKRQPTFGSDGEISFSAEVETPIDTPISVRFFDSDDEEVIEILLSLDGDMTVESIAGYEVDDSSLEIEYNTDTKVISGKFAVVSPTGGTDTDIAYFKARQRGPKGKPGKNGTGFLEIIEDIFPDEAIQSTEAIVTIRKSGVENNLTFTKKELFTRNVVPSLSGVSGLPIGDLLNAKFVGLQATVDDCKNIGTFQFKDPEIEIPDLDLPSWTPACNCLDTFRYNIQRFDWIPRNPNPVPFTIVQEVTTGDKCCQEDFYWCPNVGDLTCSIQGSPEAPRKIPIRSDAVGGEIGGSSSGESAGSVPPPGETAPPPVRDPGFTTCPLDDPSYFELQGSGVNLGEIESEGEVVRESVVTNRGKPDRYFLDVVVPDGGTEFSIDIQVQIGRSDGTFDGGLPFSIGPGESVEAAPDANQNPCALHTTMVVEVVEGVVSSLVPGNIQDAQHDSIQDGGNSIEQKTFTGMTFGAGAVLKLTVNANDTQLDCCLPYAVKVNVSSTVPETEDPIDEPPVEPPAEAPPLIGPPAEEPPEGSPIDPPALPPDDDPVDPESLPLFDGVVAIGAAGDFPMFADRPYTPQGARVPTLIDLKPNSDLHIGETIRGISINTRGENITVDLLPHEGRLDVNSITFPFDAHDATQNSMAWTQTESMEFDRNGLFIQNGPFGSGFYFLQVGQYTLNSRLVKLNLTARADMFENGFMFVSADSQNVIDNFGPSALLIVTYGTSWTVNPFANEVAGFGSNWIKEVNKGVSLPGDSIYQIILENDDSIIKKIFTEIPIEFEGAFSNIIHNPFGCVTVDVPEVVGSMVDNILGGRDDPGCAILMPPGLGVPPPEGSQTITVSFESETISVDELDGVNAEVEIQVVITTDDDERLRQGITVNIFDSFKGSGTAGVDYEFGDASQFFPAGTPSGTVFSRTLTVLQTPADPDDKTVILGVSSNPFVEIDVGELAVEIVSLQEITLSMISTDINVEEGQTSELSIENASVGVQITGITGATETENDIEITIGISDLNGTRGVDYDSTIPEGGTVITIPAGATIGQQFNLNSIDAPFFTYTALNALNNCAQITISTTTPGVTISQDTTTIDNTTPPA